MYNIEDIRNMIIQGNALEVLKNIPDESIDCIATSPPFYGLRDYQVDGQIGLENSFNEYLNKLLEITAELKRVLKKTGQLWWNHGDCYGGTSTTGRNDLNRIWKTAKGKGIDAKINKRMGTISKCLLMIPERLAIRMIDEQGWILRNKVKWCKQVLIKKENRTIGSVMPASVKDRFNESGEEFYFFVKSKKYYSNLDAVRIPNQVLGVTEHRPDGFFRSREYGYDSKYLKDYSPLSKQSGHRFNLRVEEKIKKIEGQAEKSTLYKGKNIPTIWQINQESHNFRKELSIDIEHFAMFPSSLLEIPILFGCPPDGIILDPFMGAGTVAVVAKKLGRDYIGIELNPEYIKIAEKRIANTIVNETLFDVEKGYGT